MSDVALLSFQFRLEEGGLAYRHCQSVSPELAQRMVSQLAKVFLARSGRAFGAFSGSVDDNVDDDHEPSQSKSPREGLFSHLTSFFGNGEAVDNGAGGDNGGKFEQLAQGVAQTWFEALQNASLPVAGVLHVLRHEMAGEQWLYTCWQEPQSLLAISEAGELIEQSCFDTSIVTVGVKVHINDWQRGQGERYIALVSSKAESTLKECFIDWASFKAADNTRKQTDAMLDVVEKYTSELPDEEKGDFRSKVIEYCEQQEQEGETITLKQLAEVAQTDQPQAFSRFAMEHDIDPNNEWVPDRNRIKRYAKFFGRDTDMSISFSTNSFGQTVEYDLDREALVIKQLPKSLKQQLQKYLDKYQR